jgi:Fe-S-cluster containining protein
MGAIAESSSQERALFGAIPMVEVDESAFDRMSADLADRPCPFLHEGACAIYDDRPQSCRLIGANWGIGTTQLEFECPIDLTTDEPRVVLAVEGHELAIARHESRLPELPGGIGRTTLASGLDALLRP